jgi:hypothetical protein
MKGSMHYKQVNLLFILLHALDATAARTYIQ